MEEECVQKHTDRKEIRMKDEREQRKHFQDAERENGKTFP